VYHALSGTIVQSTPGLVVLAVGGIEFEIQVSLLTYESLIGETEARLLVREQISETAHQLFGFGSPDERAIFDHLIQVSGVGAKMALKVLSNYPPDRVAQLITAGDAPSLQHVKGLGRKKAELIVASLRTALAGFAPALPGAVTPAGTKAGDAILALQRLGYTRSQSEAAASKATQALGEESTLEAVILEALRRL